MEHKDTKNGIMGALYPWIVWLLGSVFFFYKYCIQVSPSVMTDDLMQVFHVNGAGLGHLSAFYFYAYLIMQIPVGMIIDRFSPRLVTTLAIVLCSAATLLFAASSHLWLASISRALIGAGAAFAAVSCFKMAAIWFSPKRFALVSGLCMTCAMLGGVGGQMPLSLLIETAGWRQALHVLGFSGFFLAIIYYLIVRDKPKSESAKPQLNQRFFSDVIKIAKNKEAWLLSLYSGLAFMPVSVFGGLWGTPFLMTHYDLSRSLASFSASCVFIGFAMGAPFWGWFSDYIKRRLPVLIIAPMMGLVAMVFVIYSNHMPLKELQILMFLFGFGSSGFFSCFAMIRELFPMYLVGTVLGVMNTFDSLCEAIFEPLVGAVLDWTFDGQMVNGIPHFSAQGYQIALSFLPISIVLALLMLIKVKETRCMTYEERIKNEAPYPVEECVSLQKPAVH